MFNAMPRIALAPLFIIWFGIGMWSKVFIVFINAFFPVLMNTIAGVRQVDSIYLRVESSIDVLSELGFAATATGRKPNTADLGLDVLEVRSEALQQAPLPAERDDLLRVDAAWPRLGRAFRTAPVSRQTHPNPVWHSPRFHSRPATLLRLRSVPFTDPPCFFPLPLK